MITTMRRLSRSLDSATSRLQSPLLLAVRLYWGWQFVQTGRGKLGDLGKVTEYFTQLGIPAPGLNAIFISLLEFAGGFLLALGLGSRLVSLLLACDMIVAFVIADWEALVSIFSDPGKFYAAAPYTFLFASVLILSFGPGEICLDAILAKRLPSLQKSPVAALEC
jgi:putative oxidoreductase